MQGRFWILMRTYHADITHYATLEHAMFFALLLSREIGLLGLFHRSVKQYWTFLLQLTVLIFQN